MRGRIASTWLLVACGAGRLPSDPWTHLPDPGTPPHPAADTAPDAPVDASAARFADDLRAHLPGWYDLHGADVVAAGGNELAAAVTAVDPALALRVTSPEDDPGGHDLATTVVWSHPDVAFPGSDRRWFGAYDAADGARIDLFDWE